MKVDLHSKPDFGAKRLVIRLDQAEYQLTNRRVTQVELYE